MNDTPHPALRLNRKPKTESGKMKKRMNIIEAPEDDYPALAGIVSGRSVAADENRVERGFAQGQKSLPDHG
ncbi:hypothetical protein ACISK3_16610 [Morganella morganii]|nr:hypothetical protein [Morganella morganii]